MSHVMGPVSGVMCRKSPVTCHMVLTATATSYDTPLLTTPYPYPSKCHDLTAVRPRKLFLTLRKILRFVCANLFFSTSNFNLFNSFCFMIHSYYVIFGVIFLLYLAQNFKT